MKYGQVVVGPAGSGKTNYCKLMKEFMKLKKRNCYVVNLDSASEEYYYERKKKPMNMTSNIEKELNNIYDTIYDIDIRNYIEVNSLMEEDMLGPNCALLKSVEIFYEHSELLIDELNDYDDDDSYFIIDTPGQIELYTHTDYFKKILNLFIEQDIRLIVVFLIDISFISSNTKLLSAYLTSLSTMLNFELPHINILTKCDLLISKNYYKELDKFKYDHNFFYQKKLYKKINKKIKTIKSIQRNKNESYSLRRGSTNKRHGTEENGDSDGDGDGDGDEFFKEMEFINNNINNMNISNKSNRNNNSTNGYTSDINKNYNNDSDEDNNEKSFKSEYVLCSDIDSKSVSSNSSFNSAASQNGNNSNSELSEHSSSDSFGEAEENIYKKNYEKLNDILTLDPHDIIITASKCMSKKYYRLNAAFANIIEDFNLISFLPLNIYDDDNVDFIINSIDIIIQYGEDKDVNDTYDM
ncbi:nucleolar preribosomal associated cytoplasmic ATPase, putative [Hepatocystis sp. ex Piliocolobus tephrosceles]|nr:nucleolar preribosomal associated cytoplasmic ATPase, putative [Hepatocystis sp. ex Piliocolobus tephrosceles]